MNVIGWLSMFAKFARVADDLLDNFVEKYPELRDAPKKAKDDQIDNAIDELIASKFPTTDPYEEE